MQPSGPPPSVSAAMCAMASLQGKAWQQAMKCGRTAAEGTDKLARAVWKQALCDMATTWPTQHLTPTQPSAIGVNPARVLSIGGASRRDLCKAVAVRDNGGDPAMSGGAIAHLPSEIAPCTPMQTSGPPLPVSATMCAIAAQRAMASSSSSEKVRGAWHQALYHMQQVGPHITYPNTVQWQEGGAAAQEG